MRRWKGGSPRFFALVSFLTLSMSSGAFGDAGVTYHGRLLKPNGSPVDSTSVQFLLQIRTPLPSNCLLYQETHVKDLSQTNGVFSITINDGHAAQMNLEPFTLDRVFQNRGIFQFAPGKCAGAVSTYTPGPADGRQIYVSFNDGSFSGWEPLPAQAINFVPAAMESVTVGGYGASNLFRVTDVTGDPYAMSPWPLASYQKLLDLVADTTVSGGNASIGGNATGFTGSLSGDVTGGQSTTKVVKIQGLDVAETLPSDGQLLGWNHANSTWEPMTVSSVGTVDWSAVTNRPTSFEPSGDAGGDLDGTYPNPVIAESAVTTSKIGDGAVTGAKLQSGSADGQVFRFASGNWNIGKLNYKDLVNSFNNSPWPVSACDPEDVIKWSSVSDGFVCSPLSTGSVVADALADGAVTSSKILDGTIVAADLASSITDGLWASGGGNVSRSTGNVGIGTANPDVLLQVVSHSTSASATLVKLLQPNAPAASYSNYIKMGTDASSYNAADISFYNEAGGSALNRMDFGFHGTGKRMTIRGDGHIGIGTTNPSSKLHIMDGQLKISSASTGTLTVGVADVTALNPGTGASTQAAQYTSLGQQHLVLDLLNNETQDAIAFRYSAANSGAVDTIGLVMKGTGNVGIGTTTPSEKLEVAGNIKGTELCIGGDCRSAWPSAGGGGTVTSVSAGTGLTGGSITGSGTLAVDVGTTANKIVQLDASAKLPAVDGSALTNLNASQLSSGTLPSGRMPALTGDVTTTVGTTATTLSQIQGKALTISAPAAGDYLKYDGTGWINDPLSSADLSDASGLIKASQMPANCAVGQTLTFSSPTGAWVCSTIANLDASAITTGTIAAARLPASATYWTAATGGISYTSGNVGIGTTDPSRILHVQGGNGTLRVDRDANTVGFQFHRFPTGDYTTPWKGFLVGVTASGADDGKFVIADYHQNVSGGADNRFVIDNTGNIGIGTASPRGTLEVNGAVRLKAGAPSNDAATTGLAFENNGDTGLFMTNYAGASTGDLHLYTNSSPRLTVLGSGVNVGNVGIGTLNPETKLTVAGGSTDLFYLDSYVGASSNAVGMIHRHARGTASAPTATQSGDRIEFMGARGYGDTGFGGLSVVAVLGLAMENFTDSAKGSALTFETTSLGGVSRSERMRISPSGNVGIGTASPSSLLSLSKSTETATFNDALVIDNPRNNGPGNGSSIVLKAIGTNGTRLYTHIRNATPGGEVTHFGLQQYYLGSWVDRLFIKGDTGKVGIGTTSPTEKLSVAGTIESTSGGIKFPDGTTQTTAASGGGACPSGFTGLIAQGRNLGCIQDSIQAAATYSNAQINCFDNYGARLPSFGERRLAAVVASKAVTAVNEWTDSSGASGGGGNCPTIDTALTGRNSGCGSAESYYCFIPPGAF